MANQQYNWRRLWCPREVEIPFDERGYLYYYESTGSDIYPPYLVTLESISNIPCLALLGEPGIGKSTTIRGHRIEFDKLAKNKGDQTIWLDLRSKGSEERLVHALFESPEVTSWVSGKNLLHIFLDSFDECLLRIDTLATLLIEELQNYPVERLRLKIACRTVDWPQLLEVGLKQIFGEEYFGAYKLAPLSRTDVLNTALENGFDPDKFIQLVENKDIVSLAIKPVTLNFLINTFRKNSGFPSTQLELYEQGCLLLCEETNLSRIASRRVGNLTPEQRMIIAGRIATLTMFTNRFAIWTDVNLGNVPSEDITVRTISGGVEHVRGNKLIVTEFGIQEVLSTGLFTLRGANRIGWAHQTFAEFLAAWYIQGKNASNLQIMSLITHPDDPDGKLIPQLHEVSAWLAGTNNDVFQEILSREPNVLLRCDVITVESEDKEKLVNGLLTLLDKEELLDDDLRLSQHYWKLSHPKLGNQLRPYLSDESKSFLAREAAIDIAKACGAKSLQDDIISIALDRNQNIKIRTEAALAIATGDWDEVAKARLKPLALGDPTDDSMANLKGCGLLATWPEHISTKELFKTITTPMDLSVHGTIYLSFVNSRLSKSLKPEDLPTALKWLEEQPSKRGLTASFEELVDEIMWLAWNNLDYPRVVGAFAKAALHRLSLHDQILKIDPHKVDTKRHDFREILYENDDNRRKIIKAMLPHLEGSELRPTDLVFSSTPVVFNKDVPWMIEYAQLVDSVQQRFTLAKLIELTCDWWNTQQVEVIYYACEKIPTIAEVLMPRFTAVEIDSPSGDELRKHYEWLQEREKPEEPIILDPPPAKRIELLLEQFEAGELVAWWLLTREMTLELSSTKYGKENGSDLSILPGWKNSDEVTRKRIIKAGKIYLVKADPDVNSWLGTTEIFLPALAGCKALRLLIHEDSEFVENLPVEVWRKWAPVIFTYPVFGNTEDEVFFKKLVCRTYKFAAEEIIDTLITLIDKNDESRVPKGTHRLEDCWDSRLVEAIYSRIQKPEINLNIFSQLLRLLVLSGHEKTVTFATELLTPPIPTDKFKKDRVLITSRILMENTSDAGWSILWPIIQQDTEFGRELFVSIAYGPGNRANKILKCLNEKEIADLYLWLVQNFSSSEDPDIPGVITPRMSVGFWRDEIISFLRNLGTLEACNEIRLLIQELPDYKWLQRTLLRAEANMRRSTWVPPQPQDILQLLLNSKSRLVQSGEQLLEIILESLNRLEIKLQGETPAARDLWDQMPKTSMFKPVDEETFSDYIKRHFDGDIGTRGIIVNREVEIRKGEGSGQGEVTDIHVDAIMREPQNGLFQPITAIIEVKGCWHIEVNDAMKTQLVDRYLKDNQCLYGIYLVGWFNCDQWDNDDYRNSRATSNCGDLDQATERYAQKASDLSKDGLLIKSFVLNSALR